MGAMLRFLGSATSVVRLTLPKIGIGWMFALLSVNFNRVAIGELGAAAVIVTALSGMHYFLSPFQVVVGRFADRRPLLGLRRTPLLLLSALVASLVFPALPGLAGLDRAALGIPDEAALLARYSELSGRDIPADWPFVLAFSFFRLAAIAQGVAKRAEQGNASSEQAVQAGRMTGMLAELGLAALG